MGHLYEWKSTLPSDKDEKFMSDNKLLAKAKLFLDYITHSPSSIIHFE